MAHEAVEAPVANKIADTTTQAYQFYCSFPLLRNEFILQQKHTLADSAEHKVDAHAEHQEHLEHVLHQLQNKPWAALYVACIFFFVGFSWGFGILCHSTSGTIRMVSGIV